MKLRLVTAFAVLAAASLMSCGEGKPAAPAGKLSVCASMYPLYEWAKEIAGPDADVHLLEGDGGNPHTFRPSMQDIARIGQSRALLVIGLGLDPWAHRATEGAKDVALLEAGSWVKRRKMTAGADAHDHAHDHGHDHAHDHGNLDEDPHVWLDPGRGAQIAERLGEEFATLDPAHADGYRARAKACAEALRALAKELAETAAPLRGKKVITPHDAWGYLFDEYGVELAGVVQVSPSLEPSAKDIAEATKRMRETGQRAVFCEPENEAACRRLAEALGLLLVPLDPLVGAASPHGATYAERMRYNVRMLVEHLK